jgi:hypothetical protein
MRSLLFVVPLLALSACSGVKHRPGAAQVQVVKIVAAVTDCEFVGMAKPLGKWLGRDQRNIQLQNSASMMGADTVLVLDKGPNTATEGRAYRCKTPKAEAQQ